MNDLWNQLAEQLSAELVIGIVKAILILLVGLVLAAAARRLLRRLFARRFSAQTSMLIGRVVHYGILALVAVLALREVGVDLSLLLGAAGVLTVALGFAAQTSTSNLISGLFLIGERPFEIGDVIRVGATSGEVISIDLLSVRLRTFDNLMVRLPNETLLKSELTNVSRFPIRRADLLIGVAYKEQLGAVEGLLVEVADRNPLCLDEPRPMFVITGFGDSAVNLQFSVWASQASVFQLKTTLQREIKEAFDAAGIEIPFPHRSLYAGSVTGPLPVRLTTDVEKSAVPG